MTPISGAIPSSGSVTDMAEDQQQPAKESQSGSPAAHPRSDSSKRSLIAGLLVTFLIPVVTWFTSRQADGATNAMIRVYIGSGILLLWLAAWLIVFNRRPLAQRALRLLILVAVGWAVKSSIAEVWFDGDMRPRVRWVWSGPSKQQQTEAWLSRNAPETLLNETAETSPLDITTDDWAEYCGPGRNRIISEPLCTLDWQNQPPQELWRHPIGDAWSSCVIVDSLLLTQEQRGEQECVVCYHAATGDELWRHEDPARYQTALGAVGPRATPTVTPDAVFTLGATGILNALHPRTGQSIWQTNICTDAGSQMAEWGMSGSPLLFADLVIVDAGSPSGRGVAAYRQQDGELVWSSGTHPAGYTSPRLETLQGETVLLVFHGDGLEAFQPEDGTSLWFYPWTNQPRINVAQPICVDDKIFISSGYDSGCVLLDPSQLRPLQDGSEIMTPVEVWKRNRSLKLKFNEAVFHEGFVYGLDDGIMACVRLSDGKRMWKGGRYKFGHVLLWQDKLLVQAENGDVAVVETDSDKFREITRFTALNDRTWNVPVVNRGRLYVRNASELACFELPGIRKFPDGGLQ